MNAESWKGRFVTIEAVAERLSVSTRHIRRLLAKGQFPRPIKIGAAMRFDLADVEAFVERLKSGGHGEKGRAT